MKKKKIFFTAISGDVGGEVAISILEANNFPVHLFKLEEIKQINNILFVVFFTPQNKKLLKKNANINPACFSFLSEQLKEKEISDFLVACNPEKLEKVSFASSIINIATRYLRWWENGCNFSNNNFFPPWGSVPKKYPQKAIFEKWLRELKMFW